MHIFKRIELAVRHNRRQSSFNFGALAIAAYLGMLLAFFAELHGAVLPWPFLTYGAILLGLAVGLLVLTYAFYVWKEKRLIENIPTSKVRSLAMGLVEVKGAARPKAALKSPITMTDCVYYRYKIEKYVRSGKSSHWEVVDQGASTNYFYVEDDTGKILSDPVEADIHIGRDYRWTGTKPGSGWNLFGDRMLYSEWWIIAGEPVYVIGTVTRWKDARDDRKFKIAERLRNLKADAAGMREFDRDGDGNINADEWEQARQRVEQDVLKEELDHPPDTSDDFVITRDQANEVMIISDKSEKDLTRSYGWQAFGLFALGAGLVAWLGALLVTRL
ncbi:MAG: GIDE domain-containing protein [Candidatus Edwardsbacteria bacterium]|nr:GIDE domain-containing protein [Candidatus Edwardsbacteria bacterium]